LPSILPRNAEGTVVYGCRTWNRFTPNLPLTLSPPELVWILLDFSILGYPTVCPLIYLSCGPTDFPPNLFFFIAQVPFGFVIGDHLLSILFSSLPRSRPTPYPEVGNSTDFRR